MRRYATQSEIDYIPNVSFKRNAICQNYINYAISGDIQDYLMEQLEVNPQLLAWLFDDNSLFGKSPLSLSGGRYEAFQDFYDSLNIYDD